MSMRNRKNYLKSRKRRLKWSQLGYISEDSVCPNCGEKSLIQFDRYDAWACMSCLEWLDTACSDPDCPYCSLRPQTPYEAYWLYDIGAGRAGLKKRWRCDNYQHKTDGMTKHETRKQQHIIWKEKHKSQFA